MGLILTNFNEWTTKEWICWQEQKLVYKRVKVCVQNILLAHQSIPVMNKINVHYHFWEWTASRLGPTEIEFVGMWIIKYVDFDRSWWRGTGWIDPARHELSRRCNVVPDGCLAFAGHSGMSTWFGSVPWFSRQRISKYGTCIGIGANVDAWLDDTRKIVPVFVLQDRKRKADATIWWWRRSYGSNIPSL